VSVPHGEGIPARVAEALAFLRARTAAEPSVALTLGSGLGGVVDALEDAVVVSTREIPHWPPSTVPGHAGRLAIGRWCGVTVAALAGRSHRYEGYPLDRLTFGVRVLHALGARTMVFTNAVGAISPALAPGDVMIASGHLNFIGTRGMFTAGELALRAGGRAVGAHHSPVLRAELADAAARAGVRLARGVLVAGQGPSYETAAEIRMAARMGAHVAGMSTAHEVTLAAELGCAAACLSCVTNRCTGLSDVPLTHAEVTEVADQVAHRLRAILEAWLAGRAVTTA
jgi:purine-nucleoside phosphorylase